MAKETNKKQKNFQKKIVVFLVIILFISTIFLVFQTYEFLTYQKKIDNSKKQINILKEKHNLKNYNYQYLLNLKKTINERSVEYKLRNPSYSEAIDFIQNDTTDENNYSDGPALLYNCAHFSKDVNNNAEKQGFRCGFVVINFSSQYYYNISHACIVFDTTDKGFLFIEPQSDEIVDLEIGKNYWKECVKAEDPEEYNNKSDRIVENYEVFW